LIRAVRALRTALLACGWCLRGLLPVVWTAGLAPVFTVEVSAFVVALAAVAVFVPCLAVGFGFVLCVVAEVEPTGAVACAPTDRAAAGSVVISQKTRIAMQQETSRAIGIGEEMALISLL
jgi:hypothetical protein